MIAASARRDRSWLVLVACAAAYLPFTFLGYGTDIDVGNILRAGGMVLEGDGYHMSRAPGAVLHEVGTALLDRLGGSVLVNLASTGFALAALWAVHELARRDGARWPAWIVLLIAANPWFWIASTSLGDYTWALGLVLTGALQASRDRRLLAGVLFGLSLGCRGSTALIAACWLLAERLGADARRPSWRATLTTAGVATAIGALCFVPSWWAAGRHLSFLSQSAPFTGWGVNAGRWAVKNAAVIGVPAGIVFLVGIRRGFGALARWHGSVAVRFAVLSTVAAELLFLRFPFKPVHLLPVVVAVALLVGASPAVSQRWLVALFVTQLVGGLVSTTIGQPDVPHAATSGRIAIHVTEGPLLNDVRCRLEDRRAGPWPDPVDPVTVGEAHARAAANFDCQSETWKADGG